MPKRKIEDSDDDVPVFGPEAEKIAVKNLDRTAKRKRSANRRRSRRVNSLSLPKIISNKRSPVGHKRI